MSDAPTATPSGRAALSKLLSWGQQLSTTRRRADEVLEAAAPPAELPPTRGNRQQEARVPGRAATPSPAWRGIHPRNVPVLRSLYTTQATQALLDPAQYGKRSFATAGELVAWVGQHLGGTLLPPGGSYLRGTWIGPSGTPSRGGVHPMARAAGGYAPAQPVDAGPAACGPGRWAYTFLLNAQHGWGVHIWLGWPAAAEQPGVLVDWRFYDEQYLDDPSLTHIEEKDRPAHVAATAQSDVMGGLLGRM